VLRAAGRPVLTSAASDVQVRSALSAWASRPVLHLDSAEGVYGGWVASSAGGGGDRARDDFERTMGELVYGGSWCCSSWFKPSGAFFFPQPAATEVLPGGCGLDEARDEAEATCVRVQQRRRARQRPFTLNYVTDGGRDGYFVLSPQHPE
jgi:hypothetical protein